MSDHLRYVIKTTMQSHRGRKDAISRKALLDRLHAIFPEDRLPDLDRDMREVISEDGSGICSCSKGYYIAANSAEAKQAVRFPTRPRACKESLVYEPDQAGETLSLPGRVGQDLKAHPGAGRMEMRAVQGGAGQASSLHGIARRPDGPSHQR
jgi:hypothetical protein